MGQGHEPRPFRPHLISTSRSAARRPAWTPLSDRRARGDVPPALFRRSGLPSLPIDEGQDVARSLKPNRPVTQPRHQSACGRFLGACLCKSDLLLTATPALLSATGEACGAWWSDAGSSKEFTT